VRLRSFWPILLVGIVVSSCGGRQALEGDTGGMIDAAEAQAEANVALAEIPVPPGADVSVKIEDTSAIYQGGYGRSAVQGLALCAWFRYWLDGITSDDAQKTRASTAAAKVFPSWAIYLNADQSFRDVIDSAVDKANLGDPSPMAQFVKVNCGAGS
jgi:hypothetical protein